MKNDNIISKGFYRFPQAKDFISVKNHIFMQQDDKTCLAIRFANDTGFDFDSFSFYIIEFDAEGKLIGKIFVEYDNIAFAAGGTYAAKSGIIVDKRCVDFKIQFHEAFSGAYKYTVRQGKVLISYDRKKAIENGEKGSSEKKRKKGVRVRQRKFGKTRLAVLFTTLIVAVMAFATAYYMYSEYEKDKDEYKGGFRYVSLAESDSFYEKSLKTGVIYAEI